MLDSIPALVCCTGNVGYETSYGGHVLVNPELLRGFAGQVDIAAAAIQESDAGGGGERSG